MKVRLYILQHGDAVPKEEDTEMPLSDAGRRGIERIAEHLAEKDVLIQRIVHSSKLRAKQTAEIISDKLAPDINPEVVEGISPNDDPKKFIENIRSAEGAVLVASHMPFVSNLCSILLTGKPDAQFGFTPGTIACVGYEEGKWSMMCMLRPEVL